ncbi:MAG TPA: glycosyltransferase family 9 protein [Frankiaceae bacterium]|nr:glycosyltransferase family 9 protein [Frankiaceae bacterium]
MTGPTGPGRTARPDEVREIVVVELLGGFGDLLLVLPAIAALGRRFPRAALRVVTLAPGDSLLAADPSIASVTVADADDAAGGLTRHLDLHPADLAVSTTMHSGIAEVLEARVPHAVTNLWRSPPPDELVERRFLRLLAGVGVIDPADVELPLRVVLAEAEREQGARLFPPELQRPVLLLPEAGMPVKRWPRDRWHRLAEELTTAGRVCVTVPDGADLPVAHVLPRQSLREFAAVAAEVGARGGVAVGGDTGPVRLATAVGTPAVGLYGPTLGVRYGLSDPASVNLQGLPGCPVRRPTAITEQECWWSASCPLTDDGHADCMADLDERDVLHALARTRARFRDRG